MLARESRHVLCHGSQTEFNNAAAVVDKYAAGCGLRQREVDGNAAVQMTGSSRWEQEKSHAAQSEQTRRVV